MPRTSKGPQTLSTPLSKRQLLHRVPRCLPTLLHAYLLPLVNLETGLRKQCLTLLRATLYSDLQCGLTSTLPGRPKLSKISIRENPAIFASTMNRKHPLVFPKAEQKVPSAPWPLLLKGALSILRTGPLHLLMSIMVCCFAPLSV